MKRRGFQMGMKIIAKAIEATLVGQRLEYSMGDKDKVVIGRSSACDLVLNDPSVDAVHACLEKSENGWTVERMGLEDVLQNGVALPHGLCIPASPGDDFQIGVYALTFLPELKQGDDDDLGGFSNPGGIPQWASSVLVLNGPASGSSIEIVEGMAISIGRSQDCDLVLDDVRVSRRHARIVNRGGAFWIEDLQSRNGVSINSKKHKGRRRFYPGDVLGVGHYRLKVCLNIKNLDEGWARVLGMHGSRKPTVSHQGLVFGLLCLAVSLIAGVSAVLI